MAIVIVVEDGTGLDNANSYVSVADARTYATNRGVSLPVSDDDVAVMLIKATDYTEMFAPRYGGARLTTTQALAWPRTGAYVNGELIADDAIPRQLTKVSCELVLCLASGINIMPNPTLTDFVIEETVGPITTKYAAPVGGVTQTLTQVNALMGQLFAVSGWRIGVARG